MSNRGPIGGVVATKEERRRALTVTDTSAAARLLRQVLNQVPPRDGSPFPTAAQVAIVLHAQADYTAVQHMLGDSVRALGLGGAWPDPDDRAHVVCRYFQAVADQMTDAEWIDTGYSVIEREAHDAAVDYRTPKPQWWKQAEQHMARATLSEKRLEAVRALCDDYAGDPGSEDLIADIRIALTGSGS